MYRSFLKNGGHREILLKSRAYKIKTTVIVRTCMQKESRGTSDAHGHNRRKEGQMTKGNIY